MYDYETRFQNIIKQLELLVDQVNDKEELKRRIIILFNDGLLTLEKKVFDQLNNIKSDF